MCGLPEVPEVAVCDRHQRQSTQSQDIHSGFQLWRLQSEVVGLLVCRTVGSWHVHKAGMVVCGVDMLSLRAR